MIYRIAICDDEHKHMELVKSYLAKFSIKFDIDFYVEQFNQGLELLKKYYNEPSPFDIIFLDMEMPQKNGIEIAEEIRKQPDKDVLIAFITSYPEYMQDSFDVQASQYLTKPISYDLFESKLKKMISYISDLQTVVTVVSQKSGEIILHLENIVCIEADKKAGLIVTTITDSIGIKGKLSDYENNLKDKFFISIHRSCLANMKYIHRFNADSFEFSTGKIVSVSRRRLQDIKNAFSKYMLMRYKR